MHHHFHGLDLLVSGLMHGMQFRHFCKENSVCASHERLNISLDHASCMERCEKQHQTSIAPSRCERLPCANLENLKSCAPRMGHQDNPDQSWRSLFIRSVVLFLMAKHQAYLQCHSCASRSKESGWNIQLEGTQVPTYWMTGFQVSIRTFTKWKLQWTFKASIDS